MLSGPISGTYRTLNRTVVFPVSTNPLSAFRGLAYASVLSVIVWGTIIYLVVTF